MLCRYYKCDYCGKEIFEADEHYSEDDNRYFCWDCAFKLNKLTEKEYLKWCGVYLKNTHAAINLDGDIIVWVGKATPPWERSDREERNSTEYISWRENVFKRDDYTCQDCGKHGGALNAHHLKSFAKYKKLRFKLENGITLCEKCHRRRHKKKMVI
jgi:hypothetical protein